MSKSSKHFNPYFSIELEIGPHDVSYKVSYFQYDGTLEFRRFTKMDCALHWLEYHFSLFCHKQFAKAKEYKITESKDLNNGHNVAEKKVKYEE